MLSLQIKYPCVPGHDERNGIASANCVLFCLVFIKYQIDVAMEAMRITLLVGSRNKKFVLWLVVIVNVSSMLQVTSLVQLYVLQPMIKAPMAGFNVNGII